MSGKASAASAASAAGRKFDDPRVVRMRRRVDQIQARRWLYAWGGGHALFAGPYDCSGFVSAVLRAGGLLSQPLDTSRLVAWGEPGEGEVFTVWVKETGNSTTSHCYMTFKWRSGAIRVAESGDRVSQPSGWRPGRQHPRPGFEPRHVRGF